MAPTESPFLIPKNPAERRAWAIYQFKRRGTSFADLARELGVARQSISVTFFLPRADLEAAIAAKIDMTPQDLFPERFTTTGQRIHAIRGPSGPNRISATKMSPDRTKKRGRHA